MGTLFISNIYIPFKDNLSGPNNTLLTPWQPVPSIGQPLSYFGPSHLGTLKHTLLSALLGFPLCWSISKR